MILGGGGKLTLSTINKGFITTKNKFSKGLNFFVVFYFDIYNIFDVYIKIICYNKIKYDNIFSIYGLSLIMKEGVLYEIY